MTEFAPFSVTFPINTPWHLLLGLFGATCAVVGANWIAFTIVRVVARWMRGR